MPRLSVQTLWCLTLSMIDRSVDYASTDGVHSAFYTFFQNSALNAKRTLDPTYKLRSVQIQRCGRHKQRQLFYNLDMVSRNSSMTWLCFWVETFGITYISHVDATAPHLTLRNKWMVFTSAISCVGCNGTSQSAQNAVFSLHHSKHDNKSIQ